MSFDNTNQGGDSGNQGFGGNDSNQGSFNQGGEPQQQQQQGGGSFGGGNQQQAGGNAQQGGGMNATMDKYLGEGVEMASKEAGYNMDPNMANKIGDAAGNYIEKEI